MSPAYPTRNPLQGKTQAVRLMDVFLLGPFMVWSGGRLAACGHPLMGVLMGASGVGTVAYNGRNFLKLCRGTRRASRSLGTRRTLGARRGTRRIRT